MLVTLALGTRYVPAGRAGMVERSGAYRRTLRFRVGFVLPLVENVRLVELMPRQFTLRAEPFRSVDEVQLLASARLRFQVLDPVRASYAVEDLHRNLEHVAVHGLREITGVVTADELLSGSDVVAELLQERMQRLQEAWGVRVDNVEVDMRLFVRLPRQQAGEAQQVDVPTSRATVSPASP